MDKDKTKKMMRVKGEEVNWLHLPTDVQVLISEKLVYFKDYFRFGKVCRLWHSIYTQNLSNHLLARRRQLPMLMISTNKNQRGDTQNHILYDLSDKKICRSPSLTRLPPNRYRRGSTEGGWLVYVPMLPSSKVCLLNPFTKLFDKNNTIQLISLPPVPDVTNRVLAYDENEESDYAIESCQGNYIYKVVLSENPALNPNNNYVVMAAYLGYGPKPLVFYKSVDNAWTFPVNEDGCNEIADIIYFNDRFYAMNNMGEIWECDVKCSQPTIVKVATSFDDVSSSRNYLVESSGDLLHVRRTLTGHDNRDGFVHTHGFQIFKLDLQIEGNWVEMESLGGRMLFVGDSTSMSLLASDFPGCKPNCIYFTNDGYSISGRIRAEDMGIYNLEDKSIEPLYEDQLTVNTCPSCIWIEPTLLRGPN